MLPYSLQDYILEFIDYNNKKDKEYFSNYVLPHIDKNIKNCGTNQWGEMCHLCYINAIRKNKTIALCEFCKSDNMFIKIKSVSFEEFKNDNFTQHISSWRIFTQLGKDELNYIYNNTADKGSNNHKKTNINKQILALNINYLSN